MQAVSGVVGLSERSFPVDFGAIAICCSKTLTAVLVHSAMSRPWTVLEHSPIQELADNVWEVSGSVPGMAINGT